MYRANLSGLTRVVADQVLVSPPEVSKRPVDIFEQFLRKPQDVAFYGPQGWDFTDDDHVPGMASLLRWLPTRGYGKQRSWLGTWGVDADLPWKARNVLQGGTTTQVTRNRTLLQSEDNFFFGRRGTQPQQAGAELFG